MGKGSTSLSGAGLRALVLGGSYGLFALGSGCERQTFDLLDPNGLGGAGLGSAASESSGGANAVAGANSGTAGVTGGKGGSAAGNAGSGGVSFEEPCLPGDPCTDGGLDCPATVAFCTRCTSPKDCNDDAPFCDAEDGRCAQCRVHGNDCSPGEICHPLTLRCVRGCASASDCSADHRHPLCDQFGACVSCGTSADCQTLYGHSDDVCFFGTCVECYADQHCSSQKPYCVGLRCQNKH